MKPFLRRWVSRRGPIRSNPSNPSESVRGALVTRACHVLRCAVPLFCVIVVSV